MAAIPPVWGRHDGRPRRADGVQDEQHVLAGLFQERHVEVTITNLERIRCTCSALVEEEEAPARRETAEAVFVAGFVPHQVNAGEPIRVEDDVAGAFSDHLVGDSSS